MEIFFTILIMTLVVSLSGVVTGVMPFRSRFRLCKSPSVRYWRGRHFGLHVEFDPELFLVLFIHPYY